MRRFILAAAALVALAAPALAGDGRGGSYGRAYMHGQNSHIYGPGCYPGHCGGGAPSWLWGVYGKTPPSSSPPLDSRYTDAPTQAHWWPHEERQKRKFEFRQANACPDGRAGSMCVGWVPQFASGDCGAAGAVEWVPDQEAISREAACKK